MSISTDELHAQASKVTITKEAVTVHLVDGRTIIVPLVWYPRLSHATAKERKNWRLLGNGEGIHWPDLDEDISVLVVVAWFTVRLLLNGPAAL